MQIAESPLWLLWSEKSTLRASGTAFCLLKQDNMVTQEKNYEQN